MSVLINLNMLIPLTLVVIILIFILWFLYQKNKKIFIKIKEEKKRFSVYEKTISSLQLSNISSSRNEFSKLNRLSRNFFFEYFNLPKSRTYLEIEEHFRKQNKKDYADFCRNMSDANYKGKKVNPEEVKKLIEDFAGIIKSLQ